MSERRSMVPDGRPGRAVRALRRLGPAGFARLCLYNVRLLLSGRASEHRYVYDDAWDRAHGVHTAGAVEVGELDGADEARREAARYEPTPPECFSVLIEAGEIGPPGRFAFVDLGSGKGRVAMLAALAGFARVVAVEFGGALHAAAAENFRRFAAARREAAPIVAIHGDARDHRWVPEPTVCFLNNPFSGDVLDDVLAGIERSLAEHPRPFRIIYYHCNHADRVEGRPAWRVVQRGFWQSEGHHFATYAWQGSDAAEEEAE